MKLIWNDYNFMKFDVCYHSIMSTVCSTGSVRNRTVSFEKYFIKVTIFFGELHLIELGFVKFNEEKKIDVNVLLNHSCAKWISTHKKKREIIIIDISSYLVNYEIPLLEQ